MPSSTTPWRRTGDNSWGEFINDVNEILQDPPSGCDPISIIEPVEECHRWSKSDIREVHDKLNEMPGECFDFDDVPDLWKTSIISDVEDQFGSAWCECDEECPNAEADVQRNFLKSITVTGDDCLDKDANPTDLNKDLAGRLAFNTASRIYTINRGNYHFFLFPKVCRLQDDLDDLNDELDDLNESLDALNVVKTAACDADPLGSSCISLTSQVSDKEDEISDKEDEIDEKQTELDDATSNRDLVKMNYVTAAGDMLVAHKQRSTLTNGDVPCITLIEDLSFPAPAQCKEPLLCFVTWSLQKRTSNTRYTCGGIQTQFPGFPEFWTIIQSGEWDVDGNVVPLQNKGCTLLRSLCSAFSVPPGTACDGFEACGFSACNCPGCETITEYRVVIEFPTPAEE